MNRMRIIVLAAALFAALLAAYLSIGLLSRPAPPTPVPPPAPKAETLDVLVAGRNIGAGERFGSTGLQWRAWPAEGVTVDMITQSSMPDALTQLSTARARVPLIAGEPILPAKIVRAGEAGFLSSVLPSGMLAVSLPITEVSSVSGFVLPNDRVDVIYMKSLVDALGNKTSTGEAVITNAKVLAVNQSLGSANGEATIPDGRTVVLELDPKQAEVLAKLTAGGQITLALRSINDAGDAKPLLADSYRNPARLTTGPLIVRYGLERRVEPGL